MPMRDRTHAATSVIRLSKNQISYCWDSLNPGGVTVKYAGYFYCCCFLHVIQCEYLRSAPYKSVLTVITTISRTVLMWLNRRRRLRCGKGWTRSKRRQLSSFCSAKIKTRFGWIAHLHRCDWINVIKLFNTLFHSWHTREYLFILYSPPKQTQYMWSFHIILIINYHNYSNMSKTTCACIMYLELCLLTFIIKSWISWFFLCVTNLFLIWLCWKTTNNDKQMISVMKIKWYYNLSYFFNMYSFQTLFHIVYTFLINYLFFFLVFYLDEEYFILKTEYLTLL